MCGEALLRGNYKKTKKTLEQTKEEIKKRRSP